MGDDLTRAIDYSQPPLTSKCYDGHRVVTFHLLHPNSAAVNRHLSVGRLHRFAVRAHLYTNGLNRLPIPAEWQENS